MIVRSALFVDFDGMLRPYKYTEICESLWKANPDCKTRDQWGYYFAPWSIDALRYILAVTGAGIVVSSDWRKNGLKEIQEMWKQRGYPFPDRLLGVTPILETTRGHEITEWLNMHPKIKHYAILDDISDMGPSHENHFIKVNSKYGLTMKIAELCIKSFKAERIIT